MKILATESLIIQAADYHPTKLRKKALSWEQFNFILGKDQFLVFLHVWVFSAKFLGRSWSGSY